MTTRAPTVTDDDMRDALHNDSVWIILTSDQDGRDAVTQWLRTAATNVRQQINARQAEWAARSSELPAGTYEWRRTHAEHKRWKAGAKRFEGLVVRRMLTLGLDHQGNPIRKHSDEVDRYKAHADRMEAKGNEIRAALADLASVVEAHLCGDISIDELSSALDDIELGHDDGPGAPISLRTWLRAKRDLYAPGTTDASRWPERKHS